MLIPWVRELTAAEAPWLPQLRAVCQCLFFSCLNPASSWCIVSWDPFLIPRGPEKAIRIALLGIEIRTQVLFFPWKHGYKLLILQKWSSLTCLTHNEWKSGQFCSKTRHTHRYNTNNYLNQRWGARWSFVVSRSRSCLKDFVRSVSHDQPFLEEPEARERPRRRSPMIWVT